MYDNIKVALHYFSNRPEHNKFLMIELPWQKGMNASPSLIVALRPLLHSKTQVFHLIITTFHLNCLKIPTNTLVCMCVCVHNKCELNSIIKM